MFTGLFSASLLQVTRSKKLYFVDPWWEVFGPVYPDWGPYTDHGKLLTSTAHSMASGRIRRHANGTETEVLVETSASFLSRIPDQHLDWVYLDSTHSYEGTRDELALLRTKVKPGGMIAGDDWHDSLEHPHAGVSQAVKEAVARKEYAFVGAFPALQWAVRAQ